MPLNTILILTNPLNHEGGVVNYYNLFFKYFKSKTNALKHLSIGSRSYLFYYPILKRVLYPIFYIFDLIKYILTLLFNRHIKIVQVSPSLIPVPLIRDGILVIIAKMLGKKVVIFYRGWKLPTYHKIKSSAFLKMLFNKVYQQNTQQVVLASAFKNDLIALKPKGKQKIMLTTTAINSDDIITSEDRLDSVCKVLFLGRIQDLKGVGELVEAIGILHEKQLLDQFHFTIVGHEGKAGYIEALKKELSKSGVDPQKVNFAGRIVGKEKYETYAQQDVYVLPSYTEGCPNSLLEALASGLFCITTEVGAMADIIKPDDNGFFVKLKSGASIVEALLAYKNNKSNYSRLTKAITYSEIYDIKSIVHVFDKKYNELIEK